MSQSRLNFEKLTFRIGLSGTYWDKKPEFSILINGRETCIGIITCPEQQIEYVEFTREFEECSTNKLQIELINKTDKDTVQDEDKTEILKDMLLNIESIEIDGIDLGPLLWSHSEFIPKDASRPTLKGCVNLGWNGAFTLAFTTPFYLWLLENM